MSLLSLTAANVINALVAINFAAFASFGIDKARAEAGQWRIAESSLLAFALFGGTVGAYLGRSLFRHKTRKQPFSSQLFSIAVLQVVATGLAAGWYLAV